MSVGLESRRCAEHGLSLMPDLWKFLFSSSAEAGANGDLLNWDLDFGFRWRGWC
jgi:hypothetical protein